MELLKISLLTIFKPSEAFIQLKKNRKNFDIISPLIILVLLILVRVFEIYFTHYPLTQIEPRQTSILREFFKSIIPVLTWIVSCYAITTISEGETLISEQFSSTIYCLIPYIILTIPIVFFSHILSIYDISWFNFLQAIKWLWVVILIIYSTKTLNNFTIGKTILVCILSIIAAILIWLLIGLFYVLTIQVVNFIDELIKEIRLLRIR
ncbi:YIP1 family protein [Caldicellulosiruptoraceae bacterium PP1]